jgi:hypothetical protein
LAYTLNSFEVAILYHVASLVPWPHDLPIDPNFGSHKFLTYELNRSQQYQIYRDSALSYDSTVKINLRDEVARIGENLQIDG